jgi:hypothetical protein
MVKVVGAIAWVAGLVFLFLFPPFGLFILFIAAVLSILSLTWTRQARHDEVVTAAGRSAVPVRAQNQSLVQERYQELKTEQPEWGHNQTWERAERDVANGWKPAEPTEPSQRSSTADRLAELDALRDADAISDAEYETQRAQILRDI